MKREAMDRPKAMPVIEAVALKGAGLPAGDMRPAETRVTLARACRIRHLVTSLRVSMIILPNKEIQIGQK